MHMEIRVNMIQFKLIMKLLIKLNVLLKIDYIKKLDSDFYHMALNHINKIEYENIKNIITKEH